MRWRPRLALILALAFGGLAHAAGPRRAPRSAPKSGHAAPAWASLQKRGGSLSIRREPPKAPALPGQAERAVWSRPEKPSRQPGRAIADLRSLAQGAGVPGGESGQNPFDGSGLQPDGSVALPEGVRSVSVDAVRTAADVDRLVPHKRHLKHTRRALKDGAARMGPYDIYTYFDGKGGRFVGMDLSRNPGLVDALPEVHGHEKELIKKIQRWNRDVRVLFPEEHATPDLVIGGMITELKTHIGKNLELQDQLDKANSQVSDFAAEDRHGLGRGAVAIELKNEAAVPAEAVRHYLNRWRRSKVVVLDKVLVFAGEDFKIFARQRDGSYRLEAPGLSGFSPASILDESASLAQLRSSRRVSERATRLEGSPRRERLKRRARR